MASSLSSIAAKDGSTATISGGILAVDKSGAGTGPFFQAQTLVDTQGVNTATIKAATTAVASGDTAIAVGLHPTSPLPAGTNVIGHIIVDSGTVTAVTAITNALPAGTNLLGKTGIDQTTPGTTNLVALTAETTKVIGVTRNADGSGNLLTSTANALDINIKSGVNANGSATSLNSAPVVIASDQAAVATKGSASNNADAVATIAIADQGMAYGYGFNGTTWDRLRVDASKNLQVNFAASAAGAAKIEGNTYATGDGGIPAMYVRSTAVPANQSGSDGQYEMGRIKNGRVYVRGEPEMFSAVFSTLTRPANTTAYLANQSISDNATAGSVTALSASPSDTNDDPICITEILVDTNDTGLAAGIQIRAWLYNSDPTANSGVGGGNGATFSNKRAGFIGSCSGTFRAFSDGGKARLVPDEGSYIVSVPTSGAKTIFIQYQTLAGFTPSAVSTTLIGTARGFQGRV